MESENQTPYVSAYTIAPQNFRKVIQTSIDRVVNREIDIINAFNRTNVDGRFQNSLPSASTRIRNAAERPYFVIGASRVSCAFVAAP